jgi:hypothetical protein
MTTVEVKRRLGVHSMMIIKGHAHLFPMSVLHAVLQARHSSRPAGHWVMMKTKIAGVDLLAIVYAWSQRDCLYFISKCGSTESIPIKCKSKFEDDRGTRSIGQILYTFE